MEVRKVTPNLPSNCEMFVPLCENSAREFCPAVKYSPVVNAPASAGHHFSQAAQYSDNVR